MPANGYNVGSDTTITIINDGQVILSAILTMFEAKQKSAKLVSKAMDGVNRYRNQKEGWDISLEYDRADSVWDDFFALDEANQYAGLPPPKISITETTTNDDGTVVKFRYSGVTLNMDSAGARKGDAKVDVKISGEASRRKKIQ